jgi:antitoxin MazE
MYAIVSKWGNSLALRLPKHLADEAGLSEGSAVNLRVEDGKLVVSSARVRARRYKLSDLLKGYDPAKDRHPETDWGPDVGREILDPWKPKPE